jgi:hypothetical protein
VLCSSGLVADGWHCGSEWMELRVCSMWILYVENHVWGHGEVRTKHVISNGVHTWGGCPKVNPQPNPPIRLAQHCVTFWGTTATDNNQASTYGSSRAYYSTKSLIPITTGRRLYCPLASLSRWSGHQHGERRATCSRRRKNIRNTCSNAARIDMRSTNSGPFLILYALLCIFFCHCPSLPRSNISASLSLSHTYHALMVCL